MSSPRTGTRDPSLSARVVSRATLGFAGGADPRTDRPAHVRAASGLARVPGAIAVVQDDSNFVALVDPRAPGASRAVPLPRGADGRRQFGDSRGNKALKLDLEACFTLDGPRPLLVALGSGSSAAREKIALVSGWSSGGDDALEARVVEAPGLYRRLREAGEFAGSELNVEGAIVLGEALRLFGRGNGAARGAQRPVNATCDLSLRALLAHLDDPRAHEPPAPTAVRRYELGGIDGVPLGFTDAASWHDVVLFTAAAEDSPDAVRDGRVSGSAIGVIDAAGAVRWAPLVAADGTPLIEKAEGLLVDDAAAGTLWVVADADDEARPSELWQVRLTGPWAG